MLFLHTCPFRSAGDSKAFDATSPGIDRRDKSADMMLNMWQKYMPVFHDLFLTASTPVSRIDRRFKYIYEVTEMHEPLDRHVKLRVAMRRGCRERFPRHRGLAIPTYVTARAWRACRDACRVR